MSPNPGQMLLHYRLEAELGRGGMGVVYRAFDSNLRRPVAVKVLPPDLVSDPDRRRRFLREARTAAAVNHPNIATVHEVGEVGGTAFIVMELVEGRTLRSLIKSGSLTLAESLRIASQVASGLARAHRAGIVHRDLKPDNVMIDDDGLVKILDFGLAKLVEEPLPPGASQVSQMSTATEPVTREGKIVGTAAYMSPEQAKGEPVDARTDVFSFGTMLFEMVTGQLPFKGAGPMETLSAVIKDEAPRASEANPEVPEGVSALIERCLRKSPAERFAHAGDLTGSLDDVAAGPGPAAGGSIPGSAAAGRRSAWLLLVPVLLLAGAVAVATMMGLLRTGDAVEDAAPAAAKQAGLDPTLEASPRVPSVAVLPLRNLSEDPVASAHIVEGLGDILSVKLNVLADVRVAPWITSSRYRWDPDMRLGEVASTLNVAALVIGTFREIDGRITGSISLFDSASGLQVWSTEFDVPAEEQLDLHGRLAADVARQLKGPLSGQELDEVRRPVAASTEAFELYMKGATMAQSNTWEAFDMAMGFYERALELDPELGMAHVGVGSVFAARYFFGWGCGQECLDKAEESFRRALEIDPRSAEAMAGLIHVHWHRGQVHAALRMGNAALEEARETVDGLSALAESYILGGLHAKSLPVLDQILSLDPMNQRAYWYRSFATVWAGEYELALEAAEEYFRRFGDDPEVHFWAGTAYACLDELEVAAVHMERAIELFGADTNHYAIPGAAGVYLALGEEETADDLLDRGIRIAAPVVRNHPDNFQIRYALAEMHALRGDRRAFEQAVAPLPDSFQITVPRGLFYLGDREAALESLERMAAAPRESMVVMGLEYFTCAPESGELFSDPAARPFWEAVEAQRAKLAERY